MVKPIRIDKDKRLDFFTTDTGAKIQYKKDAYFVNMLI